MKSLSFFCLFFVGSAAIVWLKPHLWDDARRVCPWLPKATINIDWAAEAPPMKEEVQTPETYIPADDKTFEVLMRMSENSQTEF